MIRDRLAASKKKVQPDAVKLNSLIETIKEVSVFATFSLKLQLRASLEVFPHTHHRQLLGKEMLINNKPSASR